MKKYLSLLIVSIIAAFPLVVNAAKIKVDKEATCGEANADGIVNCTVGYEITEGSLDTIKISFKEEGGAEIISVDSADSNWTAAKTEDPDTGNLKVTMTSPGVGPTEGTLLSITYKESGQNGCRVVYDVEGASKGSTKDNGTNPGEPDTGFSLPYIALGSLALIGAAAYVSTRNKSKVYKI